MELKSLNYGIEIETIGRGRDRVARAIQEVVGGRVFHQGGVYDTWTVTDSQAREWKVMRDSSLSAASSLQAEIASPVLTYQDLPVLQEVVRAVRRAGAKVDASCGIHVHIDAAGFDGRTLGNLAKIVYKQDALIEKALGIGQGRRVRWAKPVEEELINKVISRKPKTIADFNAIWYGTERTRPTHYDNSRYHGLNLHNLWYRPQSASIEFRWFNSTLHAGEIRSYITLCLALAAKALASRSAQHGKREYNPTSAKYDFRVFLLSLGLIGTEFKNVRMHLLKHLPGSAAWKNGRRAA